MGYTIDIDTGGTFTDGFFHVDDRVETVKVSTTPHDLTVCFLECIRAGARCFDISVDDMLFNTEIIRFSNTIGTNTIIQRDGTKVGLLVTAGLEGLAPSHSQEDKPPLVRPDMVFGLNEKVSRTGNVINAPDETHALAAAQQLIDRGARCLVVAFANSEFNPANERVVRKAIKREYPREFLGSVPVFLSSDISLRSGEAERISAAILNAYIHAKLVRLLYKAGEDLRQRFYAKNLFIVHNNGAVARVAKTRAINTYNSGPAAGLLGARLVGELYKVHDLISADMGGTSFDLGFVRQGEPSYSLSPDMEGFKVNVPMLAIRAIGAGGGSIASVHKDRLRVGPHSAGALPGPVCFDLGGTEPTVTDADLILGILDPDYFLGGVMRLNYAKARELMDVKIAKPLGISVEQAAWEIKQQIDDTMGREVKRLKEGMWSDLNPLLVVYGGAGPAHCCDMARAAGLKRIVITPFSAVFSAFSASQMDVGHLYYRRIDLPLDDPTLAKTLAKAEADMQAEARRDMRGEGFASEEVTSRLELLVRAQGRGSEVKVTADPGFYHDAVTLKRVVAETTDLLAAAGESDGGRGILTMAGLMVQAPVPHYPLRETPGAVEDQEVARKGSRLVFLERGVGAQEIPAYTRSRLQHGHCVQGPAVIESAQTTVLIQRGWRLTVDQYNNALLEEGGEL